MKRIELPHKVCAMTCMVNGLEDLYEWHSAERLPDWLLFHISGLGNYCVYVKNKRAPLPRMVLWGMSTQQQYQALSNVAGFAWRVLENRTFAYSLKQAKASIDAGAPLILGALDMYHLPYFEKFYHRIHIPIHYVLMSGYDDDKELIWIRDCDRAAALPVPYSDLREAWNVNLPGLSKPNTLFRFTFDDTLPDVEKIATAGLRQLADSVLNPPASLFGIKGMRKLARELPQWPLELTVQQTEACVRHLVEYTGFPPMLPSRLAGFEMPAKHHAGRRSFAGLLVRLGESYARPAWAAAAQRFFESGTVFEQLTDVLVNYLLDGADSLALAATLIAQIADLETQGYNELATDLSS